MSYLQIKQAGEKMKINQGKITSAYDDKQAACKHLNGKVIKISYSKIDFATPSNTSIQSYRCNVNCGYEKCVCCGGNSKEFVLLDE